MRAEQRRGRRRGVVGPVRRGPRVLAQARRGPPLEPQGGGDQRFLDANDVSRPVLGRLAGPRGERREVAREVVGVDTAVAREVEPGLELLEGRRRGHEGGRGGSEEQEGEQGEEGEALIVFFG